MNKQMEEYSIEIRKAENLVLDCLELNDISTSTGAIALCTILAKMCYKSTDTKKHLAAFHETIDKCIKALETCG